MAVRTTLSARESADEQAEDVEYAYTRTRSRNTKPATRISRSGRCTNEEARQWRWSFESTLFALHTVKR
jgi:hypothetical protein